MRRICPRGTRAADIGTDHGYLAVYLLREGICPFVTAADLREQPLQKARENAARFGVSENMQFFLSDGLQSIPPGAADTIIMAGMGGDLMVRILEAAPWVCDARYTLILQPQSAGQALRQYLAEHGFAIEREALAKDGHFFYTVLRAKRGACPRFRRDSNTPRRSFCGRAGRCWARIWPGSRRLLPAQYRGCKRPMSRKNSATMKPRLRKSEK